MRPIFLISFLFLAILSPGPTEAAGLVPCGGEGEPQCQLCHLFIMGDNILELIFFRLVPLIAALMLVIGGVMFFFAGAKPDILRRAWGIITSVIIGLLIIFAAWVIVNTVFTGSGIIKMEGWQWWQIQCEIK